MNKENSIKSAYRALAVDVTNLRERVLKIILKHLFKSVHAIMEVDIMILQSLNILVISKMKNMNI